MWIKKDDISNYICFQVWWEQKPGAVRGSNVRIDSGRPCALNPEAAFYDLHLKSLCPFPIEILGIKNGSAGWLKINGREDLVADPFRIEPYEFKRLELLNEELYFMPEEDRQESHQRLGLDIYTSADHYHHFAVARRIRAIGSLED